MIKTVIFDIGKVLVAYDWKAYLKKLFQCDEEVADRLYKALFRSGIWAETDRGVWPEEKIIAAFIEREPELEEEIRYFMQRAGAGLFEQPYAREWLREVKAGGRQILYLSNWSHFLMLENPDLLSFTEEMDGGVYSCDAKLIKPDPAIYTFLLDKYSLDPAECVFIDDMPANVEGARNAGMQAILYETYEQVHEDLNTLLNAQR